MKQYISKRRKSRKGIPVYSKNPFWKPVDVKVGTKTIRIAGGTHISNEGESVEHSGIHLIEEIDKDKFIKIYTKNMKVIFELKPSTQKVLMAILDSLQKSPGTDVIYLNWFQVEDYSQTHNLNISERSFYNAMSDLLEKEFVAESDKPNMYWINPNLFFNGDRMTFIREYRMKNIEQRESKG